MTKGKMMRTMIMAVLVSGLWLANVNGEEKKPLVAVTDAAKLPVQECPWGTLQWICNEKLAPGAQQTVGLATTFPVHSNPLHFHPNCEEILYVISGCGRHTSEGQTIDLKPGMTICIPAGVKHKLANTGSEPLKTLVTFSSGERKTVFLETNSPK